VHPRALARPDEGMHNYRMEVTEGPQTNYTQWIASQCAPYLGASVLELGAGFGAITEHLAVGRELLAVELDESCVTALHERFADTPNVRVAHVDLRTAELDETFDSVVLINTLEHIGDDAGALRNIRRFLSPGGRVVIYVPACNWLYSDFDHMIGHYRRYDKPLMTAVVEAAGYRPTVLRYANLLGLPGWLVVARWLRKDMAESSDRLGFWDRTGTPASRWIESKVDVPIGLNLFCVAEPVD
jgi:SAM-dependent methyltransferase